MEGDLIKHSNCEWCIDYSGGYNYQYDIGVKVHGQIYLRLVMQIPRPFLNVGWSYLRQYLLMVYITTKVSDHCYDLGVLV